MPDNDRRLQPIGSVEHRVPVVEKTGSPILDREVHSHHPVPAVCELAAHVAPALPAVIGPVNEDVVQGSDATPDTKPPPPRPQGRDRMPAPSIDIGHPVHMPRPLSEFTTLTFDCYGTLIDWETGIWEALQPLLRRNQTIDLSRSLALEVFARSESHHETAAPGLTYPKILALAHRDLAEHLQLVTDSELNRRFGESVPFWPAFTDSPAALRYLGARYRLVILSNIDRAGFAASRDRLEADFDAVYTAEDIGSYKPDPRNFEYMLEHLASDFGVGLEEVLHVAQSLYHDHVPAQSFGLATAWIDRQHLSEGGDWGATSRVEQPPVTDYRFFSMAELAEAALRASR